MYFYIYPSTMQFGHENKYIYINICKLNKEREWRKSETSFCHLFVCYCVNNYFRLIHISLRFGLYLKVILHQFWVKKIFPWKFNLDYGGTFTKLFMYVSSRNMFLTIRNLQIRVHVYRLRHYCGDWLTFGCFVPMITDHNLVKKSFGPMIADHDLVKKR